MPTETSELGLERLICTAMTGRPRDAELSQIVPPGDGVGGSGGTRGICGRPGDYDRQ